MESLYTPGQAADSVVARGHARRDRAGEGPRARAARGATAVGWSWPGFRYSRRVQFAETDLAGIVHFSMFFRYMEEAEHALWRAAGLTIGAAERTRRLAARLRRVRLQGSAAFRRGVRRRREHRGDDAPVHSIRVYDQPRRRPCRYWNDDRGLHEEGKRPAPGDRSSHRGGRGPAGSCGGRRIVPLIDASVRQRSAMRSKVFVVAACCVAGLAAPVFAQDPAAPATAQAAVPPPPDYIKRMVDRLDLEKYKATIKGLTQFGDRRQGTDRNRAALDWIEAQLKSYGCTNTERITYTYPSPAASDPDAPARGAGGGARPTRARSRRPGGDRQRDPPRARGRELAIRHARVAQASTSRMRRARRRSILVCVR